MRQSLLLVLLTFVFISLFGMNLTMTMHKDGKMSNCPFMMNNSSSLCQMSVTEHMQKWQEMFAAIVSQASSFLLIYLVLFISFAYTLTQFTLAPPLTQIFQRYSKEHPDIRAFNPLLLAFSNGILHPKLYA